MRGRQLPSARGGRQTGERWQAEAWGGFLLLERAPRVLQVKLTGRLSQGTLDRLHAGVHRRAVGAGTLYVVLDASHLEHIPLATAESLTRREARWRELGVVALWIGLSPYLTNLLLLAHSGDEAMPAFRDWDSALQVIHRTVRQPAGVARGRLEAWGSLVH